MCVGKGLSYMEGVKKTQNKPPQKEKADTT